MSKEIESGYYCFRVVGLDNTEEMKVITSRGYLCNDYKQLRDQQIIFLKECKYKHNINNPKLTHTRRVKGEYDIY